MTRTRDLCLAERLARRTHWEGPCWVWDGSKTPLGYGMLWWEGKYQYTHRLMYSITWGHLPPGTEICHLCDQPSCIRPDHLRADSHAGNMHEAAARHRLPCKITDAAVVALRAEYLAGNTTQRALGAKYGISRSHAGDLVRGRYRKEAG